MEPINVLNLPNGFTKRCRRCRRMKAKFVRNDAYWRGVSDLCWTCATTRPLRIQTKL